MFDVATVQSVDCSDKFAVNFTETNIDLLM